MYPFPQIDNNQSADYQLTLLSLETWTSLLDSSGFESTRLVKFSSSSFFQGYLFAEFAQIVFSQTFYWKLVMYLCSEEVDNAYNL